MALTRQDLEAIGALMDEKIMASENRMMARIEEGENRTLARIEEGENRTAGNIAASENRVMSYIESHVEKQIHQIADGYLTLSEKLERMQDDIDEIKETVTAHDIIITSRYQAAK